MTLSVTGKKIRDLRMAAQMTQSDLAGYLGVSPSAIGMYEQGRRMPDHRVLLKLCDLFHTTADWLLYGDMHEEEILSDAPVDIEGFLNGVRDDMYRHQHHFIYHLSPGHARMLAPAEVERLWQAMRVASEVILQTGG